MRNFSNYNKYFLLIPLIFAAFAKTLSAQEVIYVDSSAQNIIHDGLTWPTAFTDLQDALAIAQTGDSIWVASGTYRPDGFNGDPAATFTIDKNIILLGGFAGGEISADQRNPAMNITVLSGDLNGDDIEDDFITNKSDNVMTVLFVYLVTNSTKIDGFTIRNGHADGTTTSERNGAGLFSLGKPIIRNCIFNQNRAITGGGAAYVMTPIPVVNAIFENCTFEYNKAGVQGGAVLINNSNVIMKDCIFLENSIEGSLSAGGSIYVDSGSGSGGINLELEDCIFEENNGNVGGGVFFNIRNSSNFEVRGCQFLKNESSLCGGGLGADLEGVGFSLNISNTSFMENHSARFGGGVTLLGKGGGSGTVDIVDCIIEKNTSINHSGLDLASFPTAGLINYSVVGCNFIDNEAEEVGGGLAVYANSPASFVVDSCYFTGNTAGLIAGGIVVATDDPGLQAIIRKCYLTNNNSPLGAGIGVSPFTAGEVEMTQGANIKLENCLLTGNDGNNGVISISKTGVVEILNCTVAENNATGIFSDSSSVLNLQNTILYNPTFTEYTEATNDVIFNSNGGNIVLDNSIQGESPFDFNATDPDFEFSGDSCNYYRVIEESIAVDNGVTPVNISDFDFCDADRLQGFRIDIGAFESPFFTTSVMEVISGKLTISPNPVSGILYLSLEGDASQGFSTGIITLEDASGKLLREFPFSGPEMSVPVYGLAGGLYLVTLTSEGGRMVEKVIIY